MQPQSLTNRRSRQQWAEIIRASWKKTVEQMFETGARLNEAQAELSEDDFALLLRDDLRIAPQTAYSLMQVSEKPFLLNTIKSGDLPAVPSVAIELRRLDENQHNDALEKGLLHGRLTVKAARAIAGAYRKPEGEVVGGAAHMLPSPQEARKIAQGTNRIVAASDGNLYTGASDKEVGEYVTRRRIVFGVREAVERIADCQLSPREWVEGAESHWLSDFRPGAIDDAIEWLTAAKEALGVVDA